MAQLPGPGGPLRRRVPHREGHRVDFSRPPVPRRGRATPSYQADAVIVSTGASAKMLGLRRTRPAAGPRRLDLRHLRRVLLQGRGRSPSSAAATRPWRRRRSSPSSPQGHRHPPPRRAPGVQDHAGPGLQERQDRVRLGLGGRSEMLGDKHRVEGVRVQQREDRRGDRRSPSPGLFVAIGHVPNTDAVQGPARHGRQRLPASPATGTRTNVEGVFACRRRRRPRATARPITAAGTGCMAAIDAERWLEARPHEAETIEPRRAVRGVGGQMRARAGGSDRVVRVGGSDRPQ